MSYDKQLVICRDMSYIEDWDQIKPVLTNFAQKTGLIIHVDNPHGHKSQIEDYDNKNLWIKFWSVPETSNGISTQMYEACGYSLREKASGDAFKPTGDGVQIIDKNKVVLAEIINKNNIFVLFDLPHRFQYSDKVLKFILNEYDSKYSDKTIAGFFRRLSFQCLSVLTKLTQRIKKIFEKINFPLKFPTFDQRILYTKTFFDPDTKLLYRDKNEINQRWKDLRKIAYLGNVYVSNKKILIPLGTRISSQSQLRRFHITIGLDIERGDVFSVTTQKPFSFSRYLNKKYNEQRHCLGNISGAVREFLRQRTRQDSLAVLAMKEYFRQGNS